MRLLGPLTLAIALLPGCGDEAPPVGVPDVEPGEMGIFVGAGERRTDAIDANGDGEPDRLRPLEAAFDAPLDAVVRGEDLLVIDWNGHKIRKLTDGRVEFVLGTGVEGDACEATLGDDGCPALAAQVNHPTGVAFDAEGRMLIAAWHNSKIKRYDPGTRKVVDVCGTGAREFVGDGGPCRDANGADLVSFDLPSSVAVDAVGGILVTDQANQVVRRIAPDGVITTVIGNCPGVGGFGCPEARGYEGDGGPAIEAKIANNLGQGTDPQGKLTLGPDGALYLADTGNHAVRRVSPGSDGIVGEGDPLEEIITTIAGTGEAGTGGDGGPAAEGQLSSPTDVAVGPDGSVYVADRGNHCVRRIDPEGILHTVAGRCGEEGEVQRLVVATEGHLAQPYGVAVDSSGEMLYVADTLHHCIRRVALEP